MSMKELFVTAIRNPDQLDDEESSMLRTYLFRMLTLCFFAACVAVVFVALANNAWSRYETAVIALGALSAASFLLSLQIVREVLYCILQAILGVATVSLRYGAVS